MKASDWSSPQMGMVIDLLIDNLVIDGAESLTQHKLKLLLISF
jgi:hypothetical protein